jgi:hypothetical protein
MARQVPSVTSSLTKLTILSSFIGLSSLKYNTKTNQFESRPKWRNFKFCCSFAFDVLYLFYVNYFFRFQNISNLFIVNIGGLAYMHMLMALLFCSTISNRKYENVTVVTLNKLYKFQFDLKNLKPKKTFGEIFILGVLLIEVALRVSSTWVHILSRHNLFHSHSSSAFLLELGTVLLLNFLVCIKVLSEGRLLMSYIVLTRYFDHLVLNFDQENRGKTIKQYQELLEMARNTNQMFSLMFLMCVGFYFVSTLVRVMVIYCSFYDHKKTMKSHFEILGFLFSVFKLLCIILIPNDCLRKVQLLIHFM